MLGKIWGVLAILALFCLYGSGTAPALTNHATTTPMTMTSTISRAWQDCLTARPAAASGMLGLRR